MVTIKANKFKLSISGQQAIKRTKQVKETKNPIRNTIEQRVRKLEQLIKDLSDRFSVLEKEFKL